MERRDFLALAASVPFLAAPVAAADDSKLDRPEEDSKSSSEDGADTVTIDVRIT